MKYLIIILCSLFSFIFSELCAQTEYKVVTVVESIVPMGVGRSRIIETTTEMDYKEFTTERTDGKKSKQNRVKRADAKINNFNETKLLNFFSGVGINFRNIASNDALITSMINNMAKEGWEIFNVVGGVESSGYKDNQGIFITRFIFKRD